MVYLLPVTTAIDLLGSCCQMELPSRTAVLFGPRATPVWVLVLNLVLVWTPSLTAVDPCTAELKSRQASVFTGPGINHISFWVKFLTHIVLVY